MPYQTAEERQEVCDHWLQYIMPKEFPGYVNDAHNTKTLVDYIRYSCDGYFTLVNLSKAARANDSNLHGRGVCDSPEVKAAKLKAVADKAAREAKAKIDAANEKTVTEWLNNQCPLGLIVGNDLYGSSQDKIIAFFRRNYQGQTLITAAILSEAVTVLGPALDWFDRSPEAMQLRNLPAPAPRKLTDQQMVEAGLKPARIASHLDDKPLVSVEEVARMAKEVERKRLGMPSEEQEWQAKAEQISVLTKSGRFDYGKTADLRKSFAYNKTTGKIDWKETYKLRDQLATEILRRQQTS